MSRFFKQPLGFLFFFYLLTVFGCVTAQPAKSTLKKKETAQLSSARSDLDNGRFRQAIAKLTELLEAHPEMDQLYFYRSVGHKGRYAFDRAAEDVRRGIALSQRPSARAEQELGEVLSMAGDFGGAKEAFQRALAITRESGREERVVMARARLERARIADSLASNPVPFSPTPVAGGVNSTDHFEYHPSISVDGRRLLFTRRVNREQEDFYFAIRSADGGWGEAQPLAGLNTAFDEGAQAVSADGRYLVYTSCNSPGRDRGCDLFATTRTAKGTYGTAAPLDARINTAHYEAQPTLSYDGRFLVFSSNRPGGRGGADLYISGRRPDGAWSTPVNMGSLNTTGDEQYPYWAADGKSLYFTSSGHPGLGGDDLFVTRLQADNTWSAPRNLGYPINSAENETNMFIPISADTAYYSRRYYDPDTEEIQINLYQFGLPEDLRPAPATYLRARVYDAETEQPLSATITLEALAEDQPPKSYTTDDSGGFLTILPIGNEYAFTVAKEGYLFTAQRVRVRDGTLAEPFEVAIPLSRVAAPVVADNKESDGSTVFANVLFASGSADLLPVSFTELNYLAEALLREPNFRVVISGHTDDVGTEGDNLDLSERRAESVKYYLVNAGISAGRIDTAGYGEARPIAGNDSSDGRAENRRTTFRLLTD